MIFNCKCIFDPKIKYPSLRPLRFKNNPTPQNHKPTKQNHRRAYPKAQNADRTPNAHKHSTNFRQDLQDGQDSKNGLQHPVNPVHPVNNTCDPFLF